VKIRIESETAIKRNDLLQFRTQLQLARLDYVRVASSCLSRQNVG